MSDDARIAALERGLRAATGSAPPPTLPPPTGWHGEQARLHEQALERRRQAAAQAAVRAAEEQAAEEQARLAPLQRKRDEQIAALRQRMADEEHRHSESMHKLGTELQRLIASQL